MDTLTGTARQRLERQNLLRAEAESDARPWRLAFMVILGAWIT